MRVLFGTQNQTLAVFDALSEQLKTHSKIDEVGYVVADHFYYRQFVKSKPDFERANPILLKEWEITKNPSGKPNLEFLKHWEKKLGVPSLFQVVLSDRRLSMGPHCSFTQDYSRRFTDDQLLVILERAIIRTNEIFDRLKPDVVISFISVTFLDFLVSKMAQSRGIQQLNLRPSRIGDRVYFANDLLDPTEEFRARYLQALANGSEFKVEATSYLEKFRNSKGRYEGVVAPSEKPARSLGFLRRPMQSLKRQCLNFAVYLKSDVRGDNHVPNMFLSLFFGGVINPLRARYQKRHLTPHYFDLQQANENRLAFYPMHAEPEVSLLVYGRPFLNQIEVIRALAESLPVDMLLVVKEHPWMVGKRKTSYYDKLLSIPKVRLARPSIEARAFIKKADLTAVIAGSVAFEAAILGKPALTMGHVPFNVLPENMILKCTDMAAFPEKISWLLQKHHHDENALVSYVAAMMESTESVQWYSTLLQRSDAYKERQSSFAAEIDRLANYVVRRIQTHP